MRRRRLFTLVVPMWALTAVCWDPSPARATSRPRCTTCRRCPHPPSAVPRGGVSGRISAPGGPYLYDSRGRVVFFHGVNAVYKSAPYELYPDPRKPWNFSTADASLMARLGFNVVRLGMTWSGLEPGTAPANDPAICGPGAPDDPHQFDQGDPRPVRGQPDQDRRPAGPLPHLHHPRHAPGRVQPDLRRRGRSRLGRLHQRRPEQRPAGPLVPRVRHAGGRHRLQPLLAQQRAG